jgi:maleate cis-trans isomerase
MLIEKMKERNGNIPTTTASTAALDALNALGAKKISLATPYPEELVKLQEKFLEDNGVEVLHKTWITTRTTPISEISAKIVYNLAVESNKAASEVIFISCVNLYTIELIEKLEEDLKKPVISSSQATMWRLLRLANINAEIKGHGRLFHM